MGAGKIGGEISDKLFFFFDRESHPVHFGDLARFLTDFPLFLSRTLMLWSSLLKTI